MTLGKGNTVKTASLTEKFEIILNLKNKYKLNFSENKKPSKSSLKCTKRLF
jgi:hypothetical protein